MRKIKRLNVNKEDYYTDIFNGTEKRTIIYYTKDCAVNKR